MRASSDLPRRERSKLRSTSPAGPSLLGPARGCTPNPESPDIAAVLAARPGADHSAASSFTNPMASSAGRISGLAMNSFHSKPVRWFSIMTVIGAWFSAM